MQSASEQTVFCWRNVISLPSLPEGKDVITVTLPRAGLATRDMCNESLLNGEVGMITVKNKNLGNYTQCSKGKGNREIVILKQKWQIFGLGHILPLCLRKVLNWGFFSFLFLLWEYISNFIMEIISQIKLYDKFWDWSLLVNIYNWNRFSLSWHSILEVYIFMRQ